ncbi:superoxide dismutase, Ni [Patescibacteria group bacterium]|jgi:nickel superoxide dismutase|nr:superoxide dismutase, Ni [Patescibacteria group bacterium]
MKIFNIKPVYAHCDLPCGVYDPAQAKIEAESVREIMKKYLAADEQDKIRAIIIKEQRAELVKYHLMVLWADYFKPEHIEKYPDLHQQFWLAIKQASTCKRSLDPGEAQKLIDQVDAIAEIFWETKKA